MFMIFATQILSLFSGRPYFQTPPATSAGADGPTAPGMVFLQDGAKRSTPDRIIPPKGWFTTKNPLWTWMIWRSPFRNPPFMLGCSKKLGKSPKFHSPENKKIAMLSMVGSIYDFWAGKAERIFGGQGVRLFFRWHPKILQHCNASLALACGSRLLAWRSSRPKANIANKHRKKTSENTAAYYMNQLFWGQAAFCLLIWYIYIYI